MSLKMSARPDQPGRAGEAEPEAAAPARRTRNTLHAGGAQPADIHAVGKRREVGAFAGDEAVLAGDLGVEIGDQPIDLLHRPGGVGLDAAEVAMVFLDRAADRKGGA